MYSPSVDDKPYCFQLNKADINVQQDQFANYIFEGRTTKYYLESDPKIIVEENRIMKEELPKIK